MCKLWLGDVKVEMFQLCVEVVIVLMHLNVLKTHQVFYARSQSHFYIGV